jgi:heat shock protein HslJ
MRQRRRDRYAIQIVQTQVWDNLLAARPSPPLFTLAGISLLLAACDRGANVPKPAAGSEPTAHAAVEEPVYAFDGEVAAGVRTPRGVIVGKQIIHGGFASGWYRTSITEQKGGETERVINGDGFSLTIEKGQCRRSASNPDRVIARSGPYPFELCGGTRIPILAMAGTTWQLETLDGRPVPAGRVVAATLTFRRDGRIEGTSGCNDMGSTIRWRQGLFRTGGAKITAMTLVPCEDEAADQTGANFWGKFRSARSWKRANDSLQITFADGTDATFRFLI